MRAKPDDLRQSFRADPARRLRGEVYCLVRSFVFHEDNSHKQKALTWILTATVAPVVVAASFGVAEPPGFFWLLAVVWGVIIAKMHDIEIRNFAGTEIQYDDGDE